MEDKTKTTKEVAGKRLKGKVISSKMKDTIVVAVERFVKNKKYSKYLKITKRFKVHDLGNTKKVGEQVDIVECRPMSKEKHFKLISNI
jgi:small subunit ribosomal protein S17